MPDAELVCGVIEGRIDFAVLQRKYERKVYGRLYRLVRNHADTEELTQDVFVRLFEGLPSFDPSRACLCTWLYSITTNVVMSYFRTKRRAPDSLDAMREWETPSVAGPEELHDVDERRTRMLKSVAKLEPLDRGVLIGFHVHDEAWRVVAAKHGCSERHARYRALVAMRKLRESS